MLLLSPGVNYYFYQKPVDMRKGSYGLCGVVTNDMKRNVMQRDVFVFLNKKCTTIKLVQWDGDGFCMFEKKLAKGTFERSKTQNDDVLLLSHFQLQYIIQGIILESIRYKKRLKNK
jgi:transposase